MEKDHSKRIAWLAAIVLILGNPVGIAAQAEEAGILCGLWVNTSYNQSPEPAVLLWTEGGTLTSWDESFDSRCAGTCRCVVKDRWSDSGYSYFHLIMVTSYFSEVALRASHHVYRVSRDGNRLEALQASVWPLPRSTPADTGAPAYRLYFRQLPGGLTPRQTGAGPDRTL